MPENAASALRAGMLPCRAEDLPQAHQRLEWCRRYRSAAAGSLILLMASAVSRNCMMDLSLMLRDSLKIGVLAAVVVILARQAVHRGGARAAWRGCDPDR